MRFRTFVFATLLVLLGVAAPVLAGGELGSFGQTARGFLAGYGVRHVGDIALVVTGIAGLLIGRRASANGAARRALPKG